MLLASPLPLGATPLGFFHPAPSWVTGLGFLTVTGLATVGLMRPVPSRTSLLLLLPQQGALMMSGLSALSAVVASAYADGVPRPRLFIGADQAPMILTVALHTLALIEMHSIRPAKAAPAPPAPPTDPNGLPVTAGTHT
jgi:hypothetical protein